MYPFSLLYDFIFGRDKYGVAGSSLEKSMTQVIQDIPLGQPVSLVFKDPRRLGIKDQSGRLSKRFDPEDLDSRKLIGILTNRQMVNGVMLIELAVNKITSDKGKRERLYTLMADEIDQIKVLS